MCLTCNDVFHKVQKLIKEHNYGQIVESFSKELMAVLDDIACNEGDGIIDCYKFDPLIGKLSLVVNVDGHVQNVYLQIQDNDYFKGKQGY